MTNVIRRVSPYFSKSSVTTMKKTPIKIKYDEENPPEHWAEVYNNIKIMRKDASAPVDSMVLINILINHHCLFNSIYYYNN